MKQIIAIMFNILDSVFIISFDFIDVVPSFISNCEHISHRFLFDFDHVIDAPFYKLTENQRKFL